MRCWRTWQGNNHYLRPPPSLARFFAATRLATKRQQTLVRARSLIITDIAYGICAGVVLLTGLARVLWFGKGLDYYLHNGLFHAKVGLFVLVGLISVLPTFVYLNWRNSLKAGQVPVVSARQARWVRVAIRLELSLLLGIPLLAVLLARGVGMPS